MSEFDIFEELSNFRKGVDFEKALKEKNKSKKKIKPSERLLEDIRSCGFDLSQMETVLKTKGNQLIISCAGSGKTTSLVFKIIYDLKSGWATKVVDVNGRSIRVPEKIWVSTFLRSGADELEWSLRRWQSKLHCTDTSKAIMFSTLHAEFKRALNAMGITTNIIDDKDNMTLLKGVLKPYQLINSKGKPLNSEDMRNLQGALTRTRNILDESRYDSDVYDDLNISKTLIDAILFDWRLERHKKGVYDFEDLQETLYKECYERNNQEVINFLADRYSFIYIDEFQDTSQIQYKILQIYGMRAKQVVAIGDDDQTIYSWRGSDNKIITKRFKEDFDPQINQLSVNFRCPENILKAIAPSIENNQERFSKELKASNKGGKVRIAGMNSYSNMASLLSDCIYNDVKSGKSVAVLCRTNSDGLMPALLLDKIGHFSFSISGEGMTLDSYIGRTVLSIVKLFTEKNSAPVKNALGMLTWNQYSINNLMRVCKSNKLSLWQIDAKDLAYSCPDISDTLLKWRSWRQSLGDVMALKMVLQDYRVTVFRKDSQFENIVRSVIMSVETMLEYSDYDCVEDFLYELEDINERLKGRKKRKGTNVQIATVHEFKGKEADSIYVWNDSNEVFPQKNAVTADQIEEERRVHYIACTRARQINTIMYLKTEPGMFISEMDLSDAENINPDHGYGVVLGTLKKKSEEDKNLEKFEKVSKGEDIEDSKDPNKAYMEGLIPMIDENEFWGMDDGE